MSIVTHDGAIAAIQEGLTAGSSDRSLLPSPAQVSANEENRSHNGASNNESVEGKITRFTTALREQQDESAKLGAACGDDLRELGYGD